MITTTSLYQAEAAKLNRKPVYRAKFFGYYAKEVLKDHPSGFWRLNDTTTTATDLSGNSLNGTYNGTYTQSQAGPFAFDTTAATSFDGSTGYVGVPDNDLLDPGDTFTLEAWIKPASFASNGVIFEKSTNSYVMYVASSSGTIVISKEGVATISGSLTGLSTNSWWHAVVTKSGSAVHIYINGVDVTGSVSNQTIVANNAALGIGATSGGGSTFFNGLIANAAIYPTALSAARVLAHYNCGMDTLFPFEYSTHPIHANYRDEVLADGPSGYWRLGEQVTSPVTTTAVDETGNGLTGTYQNSPTLGVVGALTGDSNTAVTLNGSNQYVSVADNDLLDPGDVFTLECWANFTTFGFLFDKNTNGYQLGPNGSGVLAFSKANVLTLATSSVTLATSVWYHIVATKNGSSIHVYVNGVDVTVAGTNATIVATASALGLGAASGGGAGYIGASLDEVAIYPVALSAARVRAHYDAGKMNFYRRNVKNYLVSPNIGASQVIPERGQCSVGPLQFTLNDQADYDSEVLADAPSMYLPLNELRGSFAYDYSGNAISGIYNNSPQFGQPGPIAYGPDWGTLFDGSTQLVTVASNALIDPGDVFTLECWMYWTAGSGNPTMIYKQANGYQFYHGNNGIIGLTKATVSTIVTATQAAASGAWAHVVATKNGSAVHLYLNGVDVTGVVTNATIVATSQPLYIGSGSNDFSGSLARVAIYPTALSATRVLAHYNAALARPGNSRNGSITRLITQPLGSSSCMRVSGQQCQFSMGFDGITEGNYVQSAFRGVVDSNPQTTDLSGYQFTINDPQTMLNVQVFNPSASKLSTAMTNADTSAIVADLTGFLSSGYAIIENEIVKYGSVIQTGVQIPDQTWSGVAYGNGRFVAVAADGSVATSSDGKNWYAGSAAEANNWNGICWSPDLALFVAVASSGTHRVMTSPDGFLWTAQTAAAANNWIAVAWSPSLSMFAAVSSANQIMTSPTGVTWTSRTTPAILLSTPKEICWSADLGIFSTVNMSSSDGITWTTRESLSGYAAITYGAAAGIYVAVGNGQVMYSADGITWTTVSLSGNWNAIAWSQSLGLFAIINSSGGISTSPDGVTWTARTSGLTNGLAISWSGSKFCAVGGSGTNRSTTSTDGVTWTAVGSVPLSATKSWVAVAFASSLGAAGRLVAVASDNTIDSAAWSDDNGRTWTLSSTSVGGLHSVAWNGTVFCAVGTNASGVAQIMTSSDGKAWTSRTPSSSTGVTLASVCWSSTLTLFVAVASNRPAQTKQVTTSPNGTTWTDRTAGDDNTWTSVAEDGAGNLVAVADSGGGGGTTHRVMTSANGTTWTVRTEAEANQWKGVCWSAGLSLWVAVAISGTHRVMTSSDGITWSTQTAAAANSWRGVTWNSTLSLLVAVSSDGTNRVMTSANATSWTSRSAVEANAWTGLTNNGTRVISVSQSGSTDSAMFSDDAINWVHGANLDIEANTWTSMVFGASLFVAVSSNGTDQVATSPDGAIWTKRTAAEANAWTGIAFDSTIPVFVAVASNGTHRVMTSTDGITWTTRTAAEANPWVGIVFTGVSGTGSSFLAVASSGTHQIMSSADGITWATQTTPSATWSAIAFASGPKWVAVASTSSTLRPMVSTNATSWSSYAAAPTPTTWTGMAWSHSLGAFAAVAASLVCTSPDGLTWTSQTIAANAWNAITENGAGIFLAVASSGASRVAYSNDGVTWTGETAANANAWTSIAIGGGITAAVANTGSGNRDMFSADGITWITYNSQLTSITRGQLGTSAVAHAVGVAVQEMIRLGPGHPVDLFLNLLQRTDKVGAAIPATLLDVVDIQAIKTLLGSSYQMEWRITIAANLLTWSQTEFFQALALFPIRSSGKYSIKMITTISATVASVNEDSTVGPAQLQWQDNFKNSIVNQVVVFWDYDVVNKLFATSKQFPTTSESIIRYGSLPLPPVQSHGFRSELPGTVELITNAIQTRLIGRYQWGLPVVTDKALASKNILEPGDDIQFTSTLVPNRSTGTRGVTNASVEIIEIQHALDAGYSNIKAVWPGW